MEMGGGLMSPTDFVEKVGGELDRVAQGFRQLAELGFAELVEVRQGRQAGAAREHVYRRIQRAHLDTQTWEELSPAQRSGFSGSMVDAYVARVTEAIQGGTIDAEIDRHLSWDLILLDRQAWSHYMAQLDVTLDGIPEMTKEAALRMNRSGEEPIPVTFGLAAFRSPRSPADVGSKALRYSQDAPESQTPSALVISPKVAKALSNPHRSRILMELRVRPMSPSQYVKEIGGSLPWISCCFRELAALGLIELVEEQKGGRRAGVEKVYRSLEPAHIDTKTWEKMPLFIREEFTGSIFSSYIARVTEAIAAGTFDAEDDRHFSWDAVSLDRIAWEQLIAQLDKRLYGLPRLEKEADERMKRSGEEPIPTLVGLAAFRSPR
jgi:hypothetical protein